MKRVVVMILACGPLLMGQQCAPTGTSPLGPVSPAPVVPMPGGSANSDPPVSGPLQPEISIQPAGHNFGRVSVGQPSVSCSFTISDLGLANLSVGAIELAGDQASSFHIEVENCAGQTLVPLAICIVNITFRPMAAGLASAILVIESNDPQTTMYNIPLSGIGY